MSVLDHALAGLLGLAISAPEVVLLVSDLAVDLSRTRVQVSAVLPDGPTIDPVVARVVGQNGLALDPVVPGAQGKVLPVGLELGAAAVPDGPDVVEPGDDLLVFRQALGGVVDASHLDQTRVGVGPVVPTRVKVPPADQAEDGE